MDVQADMDYSPLRDALQQGNFQEADDITRANLITLAGPDAEKKGWVYFSEVKFIPSTDLQTIDKLWRAATNNRCSISSSGHAKLMLLLLQSQAIISHVTPRWQGMCNKGSYLLLLAQIAFTGSVDAGHT